MNKKLIRLTESDLHKIVKKSLKRALSETADHNMAVDDKKFFDSDESWKAKKYQDERDKFLTNPNYVGTPSLYDPMNYKEVEDFVDDEEDGTYKHWMDEIGYEGATNNDSIYNIKGDFSKLANKQREHLLNQQTKPWLHNESKKVNKKLTRITESDLHSEESYNRAWENLWSQFDKNRKSINWGVYERYKGNPQAIKHWFDKWGIDVNEYLNEARNINKKQIKLTESDLKQIVKESVNKIINEAYGTMPTNDAYDITGLDAANDEWAGFSANRKNMHI